MNSTLYELRTQKGMTLRKLSALTGVPVSTINRLECGKICTQVYQLLTIAQELGTTMEDLITEPHKAKKETPNTPPVLHKDEVLWWWETILKN